MQQPTVGRQAETLGQHKTVLRVAQMDGKISKKKVKGRSFPKNGFDSLPPPPRAGLS